MIRGKGATKEGKFGRFGLPQPGEDEELHALITGLTPEAVKVAVDKVRNDTNHVYMYIHVYGVCGVIGGLITLACTSSLSCLYSTGC